MTSDHSSARQPDAPGALFGLPSDVANSDPSFHTVVGAVPGRHNGGQADEVHLVLFGDGLERVLLVTYYVPGWCSAGVDTGHVERLAAPCACASLNSYASSSDVLANDTHVRQKRGSSCGVTDMTVSTSFSHGEVPGHSANLHLTRSPGLSIVVPSRRRSTGYRTAQLTQLRYPARRPTSPLAS